MKLAWLMWLGSMMPAPEADRMCLASTIYLEARDQPQIGQWAVAEVAVRRLESGRHGATVCEVVHEPGQFATGKVHPKFQVEEPAAFDRAWKIAGEVLAQRGLPESKRQQVVPGAKFFLTTESTNVDWLKGEPVATIGAHAFYREALMASEIAPPQPSTPANARLDD